MGMTLSKLWVRGRATRPPGWSAWTLGMLMATACPLQARGAAEPTAVGIPGVATLLGEKGQAADQALSFDSDFLSMGGSQEKYVDLSYFAHKGGMQPGRYAVQVKVNDRMVDSGRLVTFRSWPGQPGKLYACVNASQIAEWWGIQASSHGELSAASPQPSSLPTDVPSPDTPGETTNTDSPHRTGVSCPVGGVMAMVPYAKEEFDFNQRLLALTVPQASLGPASRMRTSPQLWDEGMPAVLMNYNYNGSQQDSRGKKSGSDFLGINGQMNLLGWRIRNDLTWHQNEGEEAEWNTSQVYAQRDFAALNGGQLTVGHTTSAGGGVDTVPFVGMKVDSDEGMLDPKFTTYSPAITGMANSPATVTVRQYGKVIYQQNVPQGPFSLTDFNRSGNGDVEVEVREADGRTRRFTMAQANSGSLMRQGALSYSTSSGEASNSTGYAADKFVQAGMSYGVWANTSLTGGVLASKNYQALSVGTSVYAGTWGAVSYTLKTSRADLTVVPGQGGVESGMSHDVSWSRSFGDTSVGLSVSRSQTPHFHSYSELLGMTPMKSGEEQKQTFGAHDSASISLSQSLGMWGSVSLNGNRTTSWGSDTGQKDVAFSYSTTVKDIGISVSLGYNTYSGDGDGGRQNDNDGDLNPSVLDNRTDKTIAVNISLPLGKWLSASSLTGNYSYSKYNGKVSQQAGISGSALNGALSYSASQGLTGNKTGNTSVGYGGRYGAVNGGYSYGNGSNSVSYGVNGGLAIHPHGVTLGKPLALSGGNALVAVPGVGGLNVNSAVTDWRGYALVSGLTPYDLNRINVDMTNLPGDVELDTSSKNVVPTRGALVAVPFKGNKGYRLLINLVRDKDEVPFGSTMALVQDEQGALQVAGIVGEGGQAYMSGMPEKGTVIVNWGDGKDTQCMATYSLPEKADMERLNSVTAICR